MMVNRKRRMAERLVSVDQKREERLLTFAIIIIHGYCAGLLFSASPDGAAAALSAVMRSASVTQPPPIAL